MLVVRRSQLEEMVLKSPQLRVADIERHLREFRPHVAEAYSRPYLRWVIEDSVSIAMRFGIDDVQMLRVFVRLRWDIAPGFFKQPQIAAVLANQALSAIQRFERLAEADFAPAWTDALRYDGPAEWRQRFWLEAV
jgi:hypothetical protein